MTDTTVELRCHHCTQWLGETSRSLVFVGMFRDPRQRDRVEGARDSYRCKGCGWLNIFQAATRDYRAIEIKAS